MAERFPDNPWIIGNHLSWEQCSPATQDTLSSFDNPLFESTTGRTRLQPEQSLRQKGASNEDNLFLALPEQKSSPLLLEPSNSQGLFSDKKYNSPSSKKIKRRRRPRNRPRGVREMPLDKPLSPQGSAPAAHPRSMPRTDDSDLLNTTTLRRLFPELTQGLTEKEMEGRVKLCKTWGDTSYKQLNNDK